MPVERACDVSPILKLRLSTEATVLAVVALLPRGIISYPKGRIFISFDKTIINAHDRRVAVIEKETNY